MLKQNLALTNLGPNNSENISNIKLCSAGFAPFDWLNNFEQPIRALKNRVTQNYTKNYLYRIELMSLMS